MKLAPWAHFVLAQVSEGLTSAGGNLVSLEVFESSEPQTKLAPALKLRPPRVAHDDGQ